MSNGMLPNYLKMAKPNPMSNRAPWYKNTAPTYAGIFLWFVFWAPMIAAGSKTPSPAGILSQGVGPALLGLVIGAFVCHFLFYLVPGMMGMKTGLPLYIVGTSTYGTQGGFLMPGFLMGVLQFGWLGVNAYFASLALGPWFGSSVVAQKVVAVIWAAAAAFVGLKGIQYVAKVATYLPLIPVTILLIMLFKTIGGLSSFDPAKMVVTGTAAGATGGAMSFFDVLASSVTYIVGFFATAGAAGVDFGTNSRDAKDVQWGGLVGVAGAIIITGGASILIAAGAFANTGSYALNTADAGFMSKVMGSESAGKWMGLLLAIAAFPPACFSSFIAANSFKTTLPKVNPFVSVGLGAVISIILAVTGWAGQASDVFGVIGASFGPVCGAMMVDYFLAGKKWAGPRAGWNMAGWISWVAGFVVGMLPLIKVASYPLAPVLAFVVGAVLYFVLASMQPAVVPMEGSK